MMHSNTSWKGQGIRHLTGSLRTSCDGASPVAVALGAFVFNRDSVALLIAVVRFNTVFGIRRHRQP